MASISKEAQELGTISWSLIAQETATDTLLSHLLQRIEQGTQHFDRNDPAITPLWPICESAYVQEGVLLYQDRVVVPSSLRHRVLQHLHAAHQGTSSMEQRARAIVYWPGMSKDIRETRERCADCNRNAPSQPATPPTPSAPPSTPFEAVFADFFNHGGHHYLVVGDRLSAWVEVFGSAAGTNLAGAAGLMSHLRSFFATFGVPEELSSDGGPEFTAGPTERFLRNWGVRHRLSLRLLPPVEWQSRSSGQDGKASSDVEHWTNRQPQPRPVLAGNAATTQYSRPRLQRIPGTDNIWPPPTRHSLLHQPAGEVLKPPTFVPLGARHGLQRKMPSVHGSPALPNL